MTKKIITFGIVAVLLTVTFTGCGGNAISYSWSSSGLTHSEKIDSWELSAKKVNGHCARKIDFSSENLDALNVVSTNSVGVVSIVMTQGDTKITTDISGEYDGNIDMGDFEPGRIGIRLEFEHAENVVLSVRW